MRAGEVGEKVEGPLATAGEPGKRKCFALERDRLEEASWKMWPSIAKATPSSR